MQSIVSKFNQQVYQRAYFSTSRITITDGVQKTSNAFISVWHFATPSTALRVFLFSNKTRTQLFILSHSINKRSSLAPFHLNFIYISNMIKVTRVA